MDNTEKGVLENISQVLDGQLNILILIMLQGLVFASAVQIFSDSGNYFFALVNILCLISLTGIFLVRKKLALSQKIYALAVPAFFNSTWSLLHSGLTGTGILIFLMILMLAVLLLQKRQALLMALVICLIIAFIGLSIDLGLLVLDAKIMERMNHFQNWLINIIAFFILYQITARIFYFLRDKVIENIQDLKTANEELRGSLIELEQSRKTVSRLAYYDRMTGMPNRDMLSEHIISRISDSHKEGVFILMRFRSFWAVNTLYGIDVGSEIIKKVGDVSKGFLNAGELAGIIEQYTFGWWLERERKQTLANIQAFSTAYKEEIKSTYGCEIDLSWGYVAVPAQTTEMEKVLSNAELALKKSREEKSPHPVCYRDSLAEEVERENRLLTQLKSSLENKRFRTAYQKKIRISDKRITGVEALARWEDDSGTGISPEVFIDILARNQLIIPFSRIFFQQVLEDFAAIRKKYGDKVKVSVNASPPFLFMEDLLPFLKKETSEYGVDPSSIILEITEDVFIEDINYIGALIKELRKCGYGISLDDFGKGYSSLYYLSMIDFTELKIDRAFISEINSDPRVANLVEAAFNMAKALGLAVVAEGVETEEQLKILTDIGCPTIQGFLFSRPEKLTD